ncbi:hypothetical protein FGB62_66g132 [Gracilaria domingensis]|nr:hypothetical protein FGB62_66g132 [Gracilaria domingensis]
MSNSLGTERPCSLRKPDPLQSTLGVTEQRLASRRPSFSGKPPRQPTATTPGRPSSRGDLFTLAPATKQEENSQSRKGRESDEHNSKSNVTTSENLIASFATFVARCVALAPSKLENDSIGGGLRYWVGIGQTNLVFISRIGDAVTELWDTSMRKAYATGGEHLKNGLPTNAAAALRYLCQGGHPVVSLERTADAMSYIPSVLPNLGDAGKELPMRMGALVSLDIPVRLKSTLLSALRAIENRTVISLVLKNLARDKAALRRRFIRSTESQTGNYVVTLKVLEMTNESLLWNEDKVPETAVESIIMWLVIEEVLMFWSRRKYAEEAQRWKLIHEVTNLIISSIKRAPSSRSSRLLAWLLTLATGTGAASYALKALFHASGLMRTSDEIESSILDESLTQSIRGYHKISESA